MVKKFHLNTSLDIMIRGHSKSTFVDERRGGALKNEQFFTFFKKMLRFPK